MCRHRYFYSGCYASSGNIPCGIDYLPADRPGEKCELYGEYCSDDYCDGCPDYAEKEGETDGSFELYTRRGTGYPATLGR